MTETVNLMKTIIKSALLSRKCRSTRKLNRKHRTMTSAKRRSLFVHKEITIIVDELARAVGASMHCTMAASFTS